MNNNQSSKADQGMEGFCFRTSAADFKKIPGSPLAYWASRSIFENFAHCLALGDRVTPKQGLATGDNARFTRWWHEVSLSKINFTVADYSSSVIQKITWVPYSKGGGYRKWYGYAETVVFWANGGQEIRNLKDENGNERSRFRGYDYYFLPAATWGKISSGGFSCRYRGSGYVFDVGGMSAFPNEGDVSNLVAVLNANSSAEFLKILSSTLNFELGDIAKIPFYEHFLADKAIGALSKRCIEISKNDWDSSEVSWNFTNLTWLTDHRQPTLKGSYQQLRTHWREMTQEMQRLEEENNRIFINAYGLQDELTPEVPLNEITLTCNPHYRYGGDKSESELEALLLADTLRELVSYAVGCMFGRYSLDKPGLILANQSETLADFVRKVASGQLLVASDSGASDEREALQGFDRVAEGHGSRAVGLSSNQEFSQGRTVRLDQSGTPGGGVDSLQHRRGPSASINGGVQELSVDSKGVAGRSGNTTTDRNAAQLSNSGATSANHGDPSRNQQNDPRADDKTGHWPLTTSHLSFLPDDDNVIPLLDGDWFPDDITLRFRQFLRVAFGDAHYEDNLTFIEQALNIKGKRNYGLRDFFLGEFYADHVKRYKKRPIYWLFSSPKGSFNALIYMHRYRPDTVSVVLKYLRDYREKLATEKERQAAVSINPGSSQGEKTKALKEVDRLAKVLTELEDYERDTLYPLATEQVQIDLDDGVKVNYLKFRPALRKIAGLEAKDED